MSQRELEMALYAAVREAETRRHEYVTLEHLLYALTYEPNASKVLKHSGANLEKLRRELEGFLNEEIAALPVGEKVDPIQTVGFRRVLQRALVHVKSSGKEEISGANVLVALFSEPDSHAVFFLEKQGVRRLDVVGYISHGISKLDEGAEDQPADGADDDDEDGEQGEGASLKSFLINLTERARDGKIDPLIGRAKEVERVVQILCRRRKNNPLLVGEPGVGKTAIVEGLARRVIEGDVPDVLKGVEIFSLDLGALLAGHQVPRAV
jgi:ATP-dependent Clp protease ATP-binding subunit ClpA